MSNTSFSVIITDVDISTQQTPLEVQIVDENYNEQIVTPFKQLLNGFGINPPFNIIQNWTMFRISPRIFLGSNVPLNDIYITNLRIRLVAVGTIDDTKYGNVSVSTEPLFSLHVVQNGIEKVLFDVDTHVQFTQYGTVKSNADRVYIDINFVKLFGRPLLLRKASSDNMIVYFWGDFTSLTQHNLWATGYQRSVP